MHGKGWQRRGKVAIIHGLTLNTPESFLSKQGIGKFAKILFPSKIENCQYDFCCCCCSLKGGWIVSLTTCPDIGQRTRQNCRQKQIQIKNQIHLTSNACLQWTACGPNGPRWQHFRYPIHGNAYMYMGPTKPKWIVSNIFFIHALVNFIIELLHSQKIRNGLEPYTGWHNLWDFRVA